MLTSYQRRAVGKANQGLLESIWEQHRRWWFNQLMDRPRDAAAAATKTDQLRVSLSRRAHLPELLIREWEDQWDAWFDSKLSFMKRPSLKPNHAIDTRRLAREIHGRVVDLLGEPLATEVANNVAAAFMGFEIGDEDLPSVQEAMRLVLIQRMRHGHRFRARGDQLTPEAIDEVVEAVQDLEP